jgi:hypothetical protein
MTSQINHAPTITGYHTLPPAERAALENLRDLCNTHDGTDLKLAYGDVLAGPPDQQNLFLASQDGTLAGAVTLIGEDEIEAARHRAGRLPATRRNESIADLRKSGTGGRDSGQGGWRPVGVCRRSYGTRPARRLARPRPAPRPAAGR